MGFNGLDLPLWGWFWVQWGRSRPSGGVFGLDPGWIPLGSHSQFLSQFPSPSPSSIFNPLLSQNPHFSVPGFFWDSPQPSPAVLLSLPSPFPCHFWGKIPDFPLPSGTLGAAAAPELPELGNIYFFFPPFYFISSRILSHSGVPPSPPLEFSWNFGGFGNFLFVLQSLFGIFLSKNK